MSLQYFLHISKKQNVLKTFGSPSSVQHSYIGSNYLTVHTELGQFYPQPENHSLVNFTFGQAILCNASPLAMTLTFPKLTSKALHSKASFHLLKFFQSPTTVFAHQDQININSFNTPFIAGYSSVALVIVN